MNYLPRMAIRGYQKWISPYKGFRCAHHVVYADGSCSDYGLQCFEESPFFEAIQRIKDRFAACKVANQIYHLETPEERERRERELEKKKRQQNDDCSSMLMVQRPHNQLRSYN